MHDPLPVGVTIAVIPAQLASGFEGRRKKIFQTPQPMPNAMAR
jgi:hypothetical protein